MDNIKELVAFLRGGTCTGCEHYYGCIASNDGCLLMKETAGALEAQAAEIERLRLERAAAVVDLKSALLRQDECVFCAHCCEGGKPLYRPNERYLAFCRDCDGLNHFEWRGPQKEV